MENGLTACLVSDLTEKVIVLTGDEDMYGEQEDSEMESDESEGQESGHSGDEEEDSMPGRKKKKMHHEEQKMVGRKGTLKWDFEPFFF